MGSKTEEELCSVVSSLCFHVPVLQFVGTGDDPRSCQFFQMMEQRLEKVFSEAQAKVLNTNSKLSVQVLCCVTLQTVCRWCFYTKASGKLALSAGFYIL